MSKLIAGGGHRPLQPQQSRPGPGPPAADAHCRYAAEWVATKLRWSLTADEAELAALHELAGGCLSQNVAYEPAT